MILSHNAKPYRESLKEYARGMAGGLLFSFPLLYTMEVWWAGFTAAPGSLLLLICLTFVLLLGYNRFAGLRPNSTWREIIIDSVEELGLGLILSFVVLLMLNRIQPWQMSMDDLLGKIIIEAMAASIGISVGTAQLGAGKGGGKKGENPEQKKVVENGKVAMLVLAICGALLVGGNVAPTEEVLMIAVEALPHHILAMCVVSLVISMVVVYFSDFKGSQVERPNNLAYHLTFDICISYIAALAISAFALWFFGRFENTDLWNVLAQIIVLGVLSTLGASAGRLLIK